MENQTNSITQVYDDHVLREQVAYAGFSTLYEAKNPRPTLATIKRDLVSLIIVIALVIVSSACIIVSSSRTIPEFGGDFIGTIAFVMIDLGTVVYAFFRARRGANPKRLQNTVKWATAGLILTFLIGVAANVDATLKVHHIEIDSTILAIINLGVAISAPTLGFISSDVLAIELMATDIKRREAETAHLAACEVWKNDLNQAWSNQRRNWGVTKIEVEQPRQIGVVNPVKSSILQENTRFTPSRKLQQALDYFDLHPEDISIESRKLQETIGVSHTTINKAQRMKRFR